MKFNFILFFIFLIAIIPGELYGRTIIKENKILEFGDEKGIEPVSYCITEKSEAIILDNKTGRLIFFDIDGNIVYKINLIKFPQLSDFDVQDIYYENGKIYILENRTRQILVYEKNVRKEVIPLPEECVHPFRIKKIDNNMFGIYDVKIGQSIFFDKQGITKFTSWNNLITQSLYKTNHATAEIDKKNNKQINIRISDTFSSPQKNFYKLYMPDPVNSVRILGIDRKGDVKLIVSSGFGYDEKTFIISITRKGIKKYILEYNKYPGHPFTKNIIMGNDSEIYSMRKTDNKFCIFKLTTDVTFLEETN